MKTKSYPCKFLRNNPWNKSLSREKSAKIQPVKHKFLGVKKLKDWAVKLTKISFFYLFLTRENKILTREKPEKIPVKSLTYPWNFEERYPWKKFSTREKNQKNSKKAFSRVLLVFTGKKKNTGIDRLDTIFSKTLSSRVFLKILGNFFNFSKISNPQENYCALFYTYVVFTLNSSFNISQIEKN